ncbi:MLX interacting protein mondo isoform X2 [Oratosquilla oratoria]|uniref:MLX interacting protein mondo isoform X2 n=1 Tax=Oratosquilla oratoria TaxID=337810 RepID=UPI003F768AE7
MTAGSMGRKTGKETIHSGHFMVSDFEAEAQDDEENVLLEIPEDDIATSSGSHERGSGSNNQVDVTHRPLVSKEMFAIDSSLTKLFNAMSIAYRHKITSPKWNRFKGLKLRWKDKIRLNNVIWRCWHMQFIKKKRMTVCQFALDVDMHNKPEAIVLEGKYWKRRLQAVTAEYKKWRIFYKNKLNGRDIKMDFEQNMFSLDEMDWARRDLTQQRPLEDGDLMEYMDFTDALFSLVATPQPFAFPNPREIARGTGNSDFIQPGLVQLQPNLEDYFMDIVEPLQEMLAGRGLAPVPEETDFSLDLDPSPLTDTSSSILPSSAHSTSISSPLPSTTSPHHYPTKVEPVQPQDVEPWITPPTASSPLALSSSSSPSSPLHSQNLQAQLRQQQQQQQQLQQQHQLQQQQQLHHQQVHLQQLQQLQQQEEKQRQQQQQTSSNALSQNLLHQSPPVPPSGTHEFILPDSPTCLSRVRSQTTSPSLPPQYPTGASVQQQQQLSPVQSSPGLLAGQNVSSAATTIAAVASPSSNAVALGGTRIISISPGTGGGGGAEAQGGGGGAVAACPRSIFTRSHSQQDLSEVFAATPFAVPKSLPRRRSHSSGGSSTSSTGGPTPSSPISHQQQQPLPVNQVIAVSNEVVSSPQPISAINVGTNSSSKTALLAQLLSTGIPSSASITTNNVINTNTSSPINTISICSSNVSPNLQKTITPGTLIGTTSGSVLLGTQVVRSNINNTISNTISNNNSINKNIGRIVVAGGSNSNSIPVSDINSKGNLQVSSGPLLFTSINLTPVTPSSMKNLQGAQGNIVKPGMIFPANIPKMSPPHPPESPSSINLNVPSPSNKPFRPKNEVERVQYKEHRRVCHINAEQKRRCSIKSNFDILHSLIPSVSQNPNAKISKAAMLQKGAEYIHQLKQERQQLTEQADKLKSQIEYLGHEISNAQALLPATGVPMSQSRHSKLREMFDAYVRDRTLTNWKFWIFSLIIESLLESYTTSVSTSNVEDLCRTCFAWLDQHCSLNILRPVVSTSMRKLSTTTNVLSDPKGLPEEIHMRVTKQEHENRHLQRHHHHHQQHQHPR